MCPVCSRFQTTLGIFNACDCTRRLHEQLESWGGGGGGDSLPHQSLLSKQKNGSKERCSLGQKHNLQIFGVISFIKLQNDI